jgi:outer membrane protein
MRCTTVKKYYIPFILLLGTGWNIVNATTLSSLYKETISSYPSLIISGAQQAAGKTRVDQARGKLLPQVSLVGSTNRTKFKENSRSSFNGEAYTFRFTQSLYDSAKHETKNVYQSQAEQFEDNYNAQLSFISVDLIERYVAVLNTEDLVQEVQAEQELVTRQLQALRSQYKRQLAVLTDVLEIEARLDGLAAQMINATNDVAIARESLAELIGREVSEPLAGFKENFFVGLPHSEALQYWLDKSLASNSELAALKKGIKAAKFDVRQAKSQHYPTVDLELRAQQTNIGNSNAQTQETESYVAAINFTIPIFSGGSTSALTAEKNAMLIEAKAAYESQRRKLVRQVRQAYLNTNANVANISASKKSIVSAKKAFEAMSKGYKYGTVTIVDVLDSQKKVLQRYSQYRQSQYDYAINWINLLSLSGKNSEDNIKTASDWLDALN